MATVSKRSSSLEKLDWYLQHCNHAVWDRFSGDEQRAMVDEDLFAAHSVSIVLVSLIATGMVLSAVTLLAILMTS
jgi:hypothetical protein